MHQEKKWQTEMENKKRQLEDDRRALQHLKSKALREHWLLDGAPSAGPEQDEVRRQLEQDEAKTRSLEETINRLEEELVSLETGGTSMYSVEITVERDRVTGETRVLSTNTTLPVDLSHHGVKVYEDERKVVHEVNGEDGVQPLSSSEVEELIHKADEASMILQTTVTPPTTAEVQEEAPMEIVGLETKPGGTPSVTEASAENPVTMVFMGYQSVEDEDETKKVLGLKGIVKAELVLIHDANGKTPPGEVQEETPAPPPPTSTKPPVTAAVSNGETEEVRGGAVEVKGGVVEVRGGAVEVKGGAEEVREEKQPCKCCSIM
ncbi:paralemmin 1a [Cyclopterus lumpus]|uniref:paralemmin 1a n=1 Tax=Cyclopterus lumpus TaxID=8103 RepID=UPI001485FFFE|nr:paralemmin 1a [Cyclopterus lumpus]